MIEITSEAVERANRLLSGIQGGAERALSNAINRGLSRAKSQAFGQVRSVYAVKQSALNEAGKTSVQNASAGNITGYILFSGVKIPLYKFNVSHGTYGKNVRAGLKKGSLTPYDHAFVAQMKNGHIGIFERVDLDKPQKKERHGLPIKELQGLAAAQMVKNEVVMDKVYAEAQAKVEERLEHEINRILSGYGS